MDDGELTGRAGRVVVLNGTSRSGKTTLANGFRDRRAVVGDPWLVFGIDDYITKLALPFFGADRLPPAHADELSANEDVGRFSHEGVHFTATGPTTTELVFGPTGEAIIRTFHDGVAVAARNGLSVVVDDVVLSREHWDHWQSALDGIDTTWIAVECADAERRSAELGDRVPGMVEAQTPVVHSFGPHDHTIDTGALEPNDAVDELIRLLGLV